MVWRLVYDWAPQTSRVVNELRFKFDQVRYGIIEPEDRCAELKLSATKIFETEIIKT